jgi:hypothetical protein
MLMHPRRRAMIMELRNGWGCRSILLGFLCVLGWLEFAAGKACAGSLEILVVESGGPTIPITDNGGLDTDPTIGVINVNSTLLNLSLVNYQFTGLGAQSNSPGATTSSTLSESGTAQLLLGGTGSVTVLATDVDYSLPGGSTRTLLSSASNTYTNASAGDSQAFTSWFNGSNTMAGKELPSPTVTLVSSSSILPNSHGGDAAPTGVPLTTPYGLTDQITLSLSGGGLGALAQDQFSGSTVITDAAVPEPASLILMVTAIPVTALRVMRHRKPATSSR